MDQLIALRDYIRETDSQFTVTAELHWLEVRTEHYISHVKIDMEDGLYVLGLYISDDSDTVVDAWDSDSLAHTVELLRAIFR